MTQNINLDQTQFIAESPLLEDEEMKAPTELVLSAEELKQKKIKKIAISSGGGASEIYFILAVIKSRAIKEVEQVVETEEIKLTEVVVGPFNQRLLELKNELEMADPNQEEFPFPPIDDSISLDD